MKLVSGYLENMFLVKSLLWVYMNYMITTILYHPSLLYGGKINFMK